VDEKYLLLDFVLRRQQWFMYVSAAHITPQADIQTFASSPPGNLKILGTVHDCNRCMQKVTLANQAIKDVWHIIYGSSEFRIDAITSDSSPLQERRQL